MLALSQACCRSRIRVGLWIYEHSPVESSTAFLDMPRKWDGSGTEANKQQAASKQFAEWIAPQSLPFPNFPEDYRKQVKDTIKYPPEGSPDMDKS